jgi:hypothetical protein
MSLGVSKVDIQSISYGDIKLWKGSKKTSFPLHCLVLKDLERDSYTVP